MYSVSVHPADIENEEHSRNVGAQWRAELGHFRGQSICLVAKGAVTFEEQTWEWCPRTAALSLLVVCLTTAEVISPNFYMDEALDRDSGICRGELRRPESPYDSIL